MKKILCVVGARPNFVKIGPIMKALAASRHLEGYLVHTGQHYDANLSDQFFADLRIPVPDESLNVGSASQARQTAEVMIRFEPALLRAKPACVVVVGDVNSTVACALVAAKLGYPVAHVDAGLRSFDRTMPEEINRILTDQLSSLHFVTEAAGVENLEREGVDRTNIHLVGNVMVDALFENLPHAPSALEALEGVVGMAPNDVGPGSYGLVTLHRPSNVDDPESLRSYLEVLRRISGECSLIFPVHPRTRERMAALGYSEPARDGARLFVLPPLGYLKFLGLLREARFVITDSGGLQEETTALGIPCLTVRDNTERPITVELGTNELVGASPAALEKACRTVLEREGNEKKAGQKPPHWDGQTADRIVAVLESEFVGR